MQEVLRKLEQVQEIDIQINAIMAKKAEFPKRLIGFEAEIQTFTTKYNDKKKIVDELFSKLPQGVVTAEIQAAVDAYFAST